jgi:Outer membrane protein beta-barrel domain
VKPPYDWSGLYLGANLGGAWSNRTVNVAGMAWDDPGSTAFIGGFQLGYNLQAGHILIGVEGDFDWASFGRPGFTVSSPLGPVQFSDRQKWISTVAARFGFASGRWLAYGKVGGGWAQDNAALNFPNGTNGPVRIPTVVGCLAEDSNTGSSPTGRSSLNTTISTWETGLRSQSPP